MPPPFTYSGFHDFPMTAGVRKMLMNFSYLAFGKPYLHFEYFKKHMRLRFTFRQTSWASASVSFQMV